jgi:hypothetical protein
MMESYTGAPSSGGQRLGVGRNQGRGTPEEALPGVQRKRRRASALPGIPQVPTAPEVGGVRRKKRRQRGQQQPPSQGRNVGAARLPGPLAPEVPPQEAGALALSRVMGNGGYRA